MVADILNQDDIVKRLRAIFPSSVVIDRRIHPSHGYQAVHVIIKILEKAIEVQVRTELQQSWSELSEKFSDKIDPLIKYGGGDKKVKKLLQDLSDLVKGYEEQEKQKPILILSNLISSRKDIRLQNMDSIKVKIIALIKNYTNEGEKL